MITLYGRATSSNVQLVRWALEELGLEYTRVDRGGKYGGTDSDAYRAMHPFGKVPALTDDTGPVTVFEAGAIMRYLGAAYGRAPMWPGDPVARAEVDKWAEWAKVTAAANFNPPIFNPAVRFAPERRDPDQIAKAVAVYEALIGPALDRISQQGWLAGPAFTFADIAFGHLLYRYYTIDVQRGDLPVLADYYARLQTRPAYPRCVMIDYADLIGTM